MIRQGWKQRQANAFAKQAERAEREADPEFRRIQAARQAHLEEIERLQEAERARERAEREGLARVVAELLVDRLGDDLPRVMQAITKAGGLAKIVPHLDQVSSRIERERREAARESERVANEAAVTEAREQALATRAARIARDRERAAERAKAQEGRNASVAAEDAGTS